MIRRITTAFQQQLQQQPCLEQHSHVSSFVHDPPPPPAKPCVVLTDARRAKSDLHVLNPERRQIHFLAIDKCLYGDGDSERCDCALIINQQLHFIEFKTSVADRNTGPGECIRQLAASICEFYDREIIEPGETVFAYACVGFTREIPYNGARLREQQAILADKVSPRRIRLRFLVESQIKVA